MFTLTKKDFSNLHNSKCELLFAMDHLRETLSPQLVKRLDKCLELFRVGMENVYEQERSDFDRKSEHYKNIADLMSIKTAVWSIYDVSSLCDVAEGFDDAAALDYLGERVYLQSGPKTWIDLFRAADTLMRLSGDTHHVFVEGFHKTDVAGVITMSTGS